MTVLLILTYGFPLGMTNIIILDAHFEQRLMS
jgi:hypothetical protein